MSEDWRPVPGYAGYEVSDRGRVRSSRQRKLRIIWPSDRRGYLRVRLHLGDGRSVNRDIHQLVALAFIGRRPVGLEVRHLDGDRAMNDRSNIAYGTRAENASDAISHGTHAMASKTHCKRGHPFDEKNTKPARLRTGGWSRQCRKCNALRMRGYRKGRAA